MQSRGTSTLKTKLEQSLTAYAAAASAAGVGLLTLAQPAEARVVYTAVHEVIPPGSDYRIDLNQDGKADFRIYNLLSYTSDQVVSVLYGFGGLVYAQKPARNINPRMHPNLAEAQRLCDRAFQRVENAQRANGFDLGGHAAKAKDLLRQASDELKEAARVANQHAGH